jgi:O-6-methylguanine DNA methyltransferase
MRVRHSERRQGTGTAGAGPAFITLHANTAAGVFEATYCAEGLCGLAFPRESAPPARACDKIPSAIRSFHALTNHALQRVLEGRDPGPLPPLRLVSGTEFQRKVWRAMRAIPFGQTKSYQDIASAIGHPKATRAVGGACGANPIPVFIPCHRVLAAGGRLGGFSGGLDWKRRLLSLEGRWTPELQKSFKGTE